MNHLRIQFLRKRFSAVFILSLVWSVWLPLYAQVIIKDTVVISPGRTIEPEDGLWIMKTPEILPNAIYNDSNEIRLEISWDQPVYAVRAYILSPLGELVVYGVGSDSLISYTFGVPNPGYYSITPQACGPWPVGVNVTFTSRIFLNDTLVAQASETWYLLGCCCGGYCYCVFYDARAHYSYTPVSHVRFEVVAEGDTLGSGDTTQVRAIALDVQDREVWINPATLLTYRLQPDTLGRFINATGDTVPTPLSNVPYQDARAGRIRFLANRIPPDTPRVATIKVVQMNDTTKRGSDTVWIKNAAYVKITRPNSTNIYPTYPGQNDSTTKRNWMALELRVVLSDSTPVPNYWVRLDTAALVDSGGHSHDGARPKSRYIVPKLTGQDVDTITSGARKTDSTGVLSFKFLASQFGGKERIRAHLVSDTTKFDTLSLITRVPGLQLLPEGTNYVKVGGTCTHHGPSTSAPTACRTPDNNHWGTQQMMDSLRAGILKFYRWSGSSKGVGQYIVLKINDMSLPSGGVFDIDGDWRLDYHLYHRLGLSADINYQGLDSTQIAMLTSIMHDKQGERNAERPFIHYGFFGGN